MSLRFPGMEMLIVAAVCLACNSVVEGSARNLEKPEIAIPSEGGKLDEVVERMQTVLTAQAKEFAGGRALNAQSVLHFKGGTKTVNALLGELSKVDGATLHVRLSKASSGAGIVNLIRPSGSKLPETNPGCCTVEHNAWADAHDISLTIHIDDDTIDVDALELPPIACPSNR